MSRITHANVGAGTREKHSKPRRQAEPPTQEHHPRGSGCSDEVVLQGIAGGGTAGGDLDLGVDRGEVVVDRPSADHELLGDLGIGESLGHEPQYVDLAGGQVVGKGG